MAEYSTELHDSCFPFLEKHETEILLGVMKSVFLQQELLFSRKMIRLTVFISFKQDRLLCKIKQDLEKECRLLPCSLTELL